MTYRVIFYPRPTAIPHARSFGTYEQAETWLDASGHPGHIEEFVRGIGWVVCEARV